MISEKQFKDDDRVRDHLANERTFLAWLRTGVAAMGLGVVIAKLRYILGSNYPESSGIVHAANIGLIFALAGITTIILSVFFFCKSVVKLGLAVMFRKPNWFLDWQLLW